MVYSFTGAHRSGKTTLAKAVAEDLGIEFYETRSGEVLKAAGINLVGALSLEERLRVQELLLDHHLVQLRELPRPLIVDRCPIDFYAYTIAEIGMHAGVDEAFDKRLVSYLKRCLAEMERHYCVAIVCAPLPHYDAQPGKPPPVIAYQHHIHALIEGAVHGLEHITHASLPVMGFDHRRQAAAEVIVDAMQSMEQDKSGVWIN